MKSVGAFIYKSDPTPHVAAYTLTLWVQTTYQI